MLVPDRGDVSGRETAAPWLADDGNVLDPNGRAYRAKNDPACACAYALFVKRNKTVPVYNSCVSTGISRGNCTRKRVVRSLLETRADAKVKIAERIVLPLTAHGADHLTANIGVITFITDLPDRRTT